MALTGTLIGLGLTPPVEKRKNLYITVPACTILSAVFLMHVQGRVSWLTVKDVVMLPPVACLVAAFGVVIIPALFKPETTGLVIKAIRAFLARAGTPRRRTVNRTDLRSPRTLHDAKERAKTGVLAMTFALGIYAAVMVIPPGLFTYLLSLPPAGIVILTAWHRINALGIEVANTHWNVRRSGLIFTAMFGFAVLIWPWLQGEWTPWIVVIGIWGYAKTWLTTPNQPPWREDVFGPVRTSKAQHPHRRKSDSPEGEPPC